MCQARSRTLSRNRSRMGRSQPAQCTIIPAAGQGGRAAAAPPAQASRRRLPAAAAAGPAPSLPGRSARSSSGRLLPWPSSRAAPSLRWPPAFSAASAGSLDGGGQGRGPPPLPLRPSPSPACGWLLPGTLLHFHAVPIPELCLPALVIRASLFRFGDVGRRVGQAAANGRPVAMATS